MVPYSLLLTTMAFLSLPLADDEELVKITCSDGYELDAKIRPAEGVDPNAPQRVMILIHGSGPQSMDVDFTIVTKGQKKNQLFVEFADALSGAGFHVVRYNKRSYQLKFSLLDDPSLAQSDTVKAFQENPLKFFVDDAKDVVSFAQDRFEDSDIYILGHSQGTYVGLQVAHQLEDIRGVAMIGFYSVPTDFLLHNQIVYRPLGLFRKLDANGDDALSRDELKVDDIPLAKSLEMQWTGIDLDGDDILSELEYTAANLSNTMLRDLGMGAFRKQELVYPTVSEILKNASFKVAFYQGLWDNQTPAYHAKAVELINNKVWKNNNMQFHYFHELGHALDRRTSYDDLQYDTIDPDAFEATVEGIAAFFNSQGRP